MFRRIRILPFWRPSPLLPARRQPTPESTAPKAPLYDNLGAYHHAITTESPDAQKYFDQGLTLSYAFNHAEAIRAFQQAIALDPECAMCYWGVAFALGPNINAPITEDAAKEAFAAIEQARTHAAGATDKERAYIDALAKRYVADPKAERAPLDRAYADAMREVVKRFPDDLDAATLFAQSLMDTSPWNYWEQDGSPRAVHQRSDRVARVGARAQARSHRRDPPVHPRRRSVARSGPRRAVRRQAGGARAGRRPPRPHAGAHLPADRPLQRRVDGQRRRHQGRRGVLRRRRGARAT